MLSAPPRLMVTALRGGAGKTILTLGLAAAWKEAGKRVIPFKKGPDFIDPGWLSLAAGAVCRNLDPFMMDEAQILNSFARHTRGADAALIEGNRGLFDGLDLNGCCSSAELARSLRCPTVLIVDVTMTTRTVAALVMGCQAFDAHLDLRGVILNRVGGPRQESVVRSAVEQYCGVPVLGSVRKLGDNRFPERHMGLIPRQERERAGEAVSWACSVVRESLDLDALWDLALGAVPFRLPAEREHGGGGAHDAASPRPRIGYLLDSAFWFYYPENLSALEEAGAELVALSAVEDPGLPPLDGLYIGGGFPETQADRLAANQAFREDLRGRIEGGLPVYAECGGLMYLGEHLVVKERTYPMVGALPVDFLLERKPQGHGYTVLEVTADNPFYEPGTRLKGHEFHYSRPVFRNREALRPVFRVERGRGLDGENDGLCRHNLLATYTHIHALGAPFWAEGMVRRATAFRETHGANFSSDLQKRD